MNSSINLLSNVIILRILLISLLLYPNHILLSYLFADGPLLVWRQLLIAYCLFCGVWLIKINKLQIESYIFINYFALIFAGMIISLVQGYSFARVTYAAFLYLGGISFILFARTITKLQSWGKVFVTFHYLGIFLIFGIFLDFYTDIFIDIPRGEYSNLDESDAENFVRRASLFFGSATTVFPTLAICLISTMIKIYCNKYKYENLLFIFYISMYSVCIFFVYSKAAIFSWFTLLLILGMFLFRYIFFEFKIKIFLFVIITIFVLGIALNFYLFNIGLNEDAIIDIFKFIFDGGDESNSRRFLRWSQGLLLFEPNIFQLMGHPLWQCDGIAGVCHSLVC